MEKADINIELELERLKHDLAVQGSELDSYKKSFKWTRDYSHDKISKQAASFDKIWTDNIYQLEKYIRVVDESNLDFITLIYTTLNEITTYVSDYYMSRYSSILESEDFLKYTILKDEKEIKHGKGNITK